MCNLVNTKAHTYTHIHSYFTVSLHVNMLIVLLTNRDISLIRRGRLHSSCVRSSMLHGRLDDDQDGGWVDVSSGTGSPG